MSKNKSFSDTFRKTNRKFHYFLQNVLCIDGILTLHISHSEHSEFVYVLVYTFRISHRMRFAVI